MGIGVSLGLADAAVGTVRSGREIAGEAVRTLPRLARLGRLQPHTKVSLGGLMAEQANRVPEGECFLFDDRVHTNAVVDHRIDEVVRGLIAVGIRQGARIGVLMDTSPSAVVAIAALSRLGAVAVLLPPDDDLAAAVQLCEVADIVTDPDHRAAAAATGARVLILGQDHHTADLGHPESDRVVELDRLDLSGAAATAAGIARTQAGQVISPSCSSARRADAERSRRSPIIGGRCRPTARPQPPRSTAATRSIA